MPFALLSLAALAPVAAEPPAVVRLTDDVAGHAALDSEAAPEAEAVPEAEAGADAPADIAAAAAAVVADPAAPEWEHDLAVAFGEARTSGKPLLIVFGAEWCRYCHKQDDLTLADAAVAARIAERYVPVRLDFDAARHVATALEVEILPHAVILTPEADLLGRAAGYHTVPQFAKVLDAAESAAGTGRTRVAARPTVTRVR